MRYDVNLKQWRKIMRTLLKLAAALLLAGFAMPMFGQAAGAQLPDPNEARASAVFSLLEKADAVGKVNVIVGLELPTPYVAEGALRSFSAIADQRSAIAEARQALNVDLRNLGATEYSHWETLPHMALKVGREALERLASSPLVATIQEDRLSDPLLASSTRLIGADLTAASGFRGDNWAVVITDTGIDADHPFYSGRVVYQACYSNGAGGGATLCPGGAITQFGPGAAEVTQAGGAPIPNCDDGAGNQICSHGSHVAGIAAGEDPASNPQGFNGVAPDAYIIAIQVFTRFNADADCGGAGTAPCVKSYSSDQINALNHVNTALVLLWDIASVNMSLGGGQFNVACDGDALKAPIDALKANGVATAIAAGNDDWTDTISAPGCISSAVTVGSVTDADVVNQNMGALVDILAPGVGVDSSVPDDVFGSKTGTSMSTPHVAGAFAVVRSIVGPTWSVDDILTLLQNTAPLITDTRAANNPGGAGSGTLTGYVKPRLQLDIAVASLTEADVRVLKDCKPDGPLVTGQTATCTIFVDNLGPGPAINVTLVDEELSNGTFTIGAVTTSAGICTKSVGPQVGSSTVNCDLGNMAAGDRITIEIPIEASTPQDVDDVATVSSDSQDPDMNNNVATDHLTFVDPEADLALLKECEPTSPVPAGGTAWCTLRVHNFGPGTAQNLLLVDDLTSNGMPFSIGVITSSAGVCGAIGNMVSCSLGSLAAGGNWIVTVPVTSTTPQEIDDTALVESDTADSNTANNTAHGTVSFTGLADLSLGKSVSPGPYVAGTTMTYTLTATNGGPSVAFNVKVRDQLPEGLSVVSVTSAGNTCNPGAPGVTPTVCNLDSLMVGASEMVTIVVLIDPAVPDGTILGNNASVSSDTADGNNANNFATTNSTVSAIADLRIVKADVPDPVVAGAGLSYVMSITNLSPSWARDVVMTDTLPAQVGFVSATIAGGAGVCVPLAGMLTVVQCTLGDLANGAMREITIQTRVSASVPDGAMIINRATVASSTPDPTMSDNSAGSQTTVMTRADIWIDKTGAQLTGNPSRTIRYTLGVYNKPGCEADDPLSCGMGGPSDAQNVVVTDTLPLTPKKVKVVFVSQNCSYDQVLHKVTCNVAGGVLPAGQSATFVIDIQVAGSVSNFTNNVTATTTTVDPSPANNSDQLKMIVKGGTARPGQ
jgi:uncharacterized repeat protein (TIGR01451 family)